ncbi:MAG: RNA polymerase sigma factor [Saprospiraceae bacterium]|nr:RNA polymerase sigma factor [Saprospiraceae bacterium]
MKVVDINQDLFSIIDLSVRQDRMAQKQLFNRFSPRLLSICRQYIPDMYQAEDVMIAAFMKIFSKLHTFERKGNFEAWIRRIAINESISFIRSNKPVPDGEEILNGLSDTHQTADLLYKDDYQNMIDSLPEGCKIVFNLYAIEGFRHLEIAEMLQISEGTSKSQLAYARRLLQNMINQENKTYNG